MSKSLPSRTPWERTGWYPASIKPVRVGVYQRDMQDSGNGEYSFWDGESWGGWGNSIEIAARNAGSKSSVQDANWRGLAQEPK